MSKMQVTRAHVERMQKALKSASARASRMKEQAEELTKQVKNTAEIGGTAFLMGYVNHRFRGDNGEPGIEVLGIPLDLGLGIGAHLAGLFMGGNYASDLHNVANGSLAAYLTTMASGLGTKHYNERSQSAPAAPAAAEGRRRVGPGMTSVSDDAIRRIANRL